MELKRTSPEEIPQAIRDGPDEKRGRGRMVYALLFLLLAAVLALAVLRMRHGKQEGTAGGLAYEANVVVGDLPGKSMEERQAELDQVVAEGMLSMSVNATPFGSLGTDGGAVNWLIENPSNQGKLIRVEIRLEDGELIYETGALRPGTYVESAPLKSPLEAGRYDCTAIFYTYNMDTEEYIGQAAAEITLTLVQ